MEKERLYDPSDDEVEGDDLNIGDEVHLNNFPDPGNFDPLQRLGSNHHTNSLIIGKT
jgi:hypothetical protein